jgi:predicted kinase
MKTMILIRGLPGSGKTTFANFLQSLGENVAICSADHYFEDPVTGEYKFDDSKLRQAHISCQQHAEFEMTQGNTVVISNVNARTREMKIYEELAEKYEYQVFHIVVENRHGNKSIHNVSDDLLEKMRARFKISL